MNLKDYLYYEDKWCKIYNADCRLILPLLEPVDLVITSPPYNAGMEYEKNITDSQYLSFVKSYLDATYGVLRSGGRLAINVAPNSVSNGLWHQIMQIHMVALWGIFQLQDIIAWNKNVTDGGTAWGSWLSASCPFFRHENEYVLLAYKDKWHHGKGDSDLKSSLEFQKLTTDVWKIPPSKRNGHPATFPIGLSDRIIKLLSFKQEIILDPFMGGGTTLESAKNLNRKSIGIEIEPKYCEIAVQRLKQEVFDFRSKP